MTTDEIDELILQLCHSGDRLEAIRILRRERGYSATDAMEFVNELMLN